MKTLLLCLLAASLGAGDWSDSTYRAASMSDTVAIDTSKHIIFNPGDFQIPCDTVKHEPATVKPQPIGYWVECDTVWGLKWFHADEWGDTLGKEKP